MNQRRLSAIIISTTSLPRGGINTCYRKYTSNMHFSWTLAYFFPRADIYRKSLILRRFVNKYSRQTHALCTLIILPGARYCLSLTRQIAMQPRKTSFRNLECTFMNVNNAERSGT